MKQWLSTKDDVEGKEGNKRYTLSKVGCVAIVPTAIILQRATAAAAAEAAAVYQLLAHKMLASPQWLLSSALCVLRMATRQII